MTIDTIGLLELVLLVFDMGCIFILLLLMFNEVVAIWLTVILYVVLKILLYLQIALGQHYMIEVV